MRSSHLRVLVFFAVVVAALCLFLAGVAYGAYRKRATAGGKSEGGTGSSGRETGLDNPTYYDASGKKKAGFGFGSGSTEGEQDVAGYLEVDGTQITR